MNRKDQDHQGLMSDRDLDRLLTAVSGPKPPLGAQARLLSRIAAETAASQPQAATWRWIMAAPLAASLALGVYLGAAGYGTGLLFTDDVAYAGSFETGIEEAELAAEEDQS
jgi:hypothetical protein